MRDRHTGGSASARFAVTGCPAEMADAALSRPGRREPRKKHDLRKTQTCVKPRPAQNPDLRKTQTCTKTRSARAFGMRRDREWLLPHSL
jgi:hypothetical protein